MKRLSCLLLLSCLAAIFICLQPVSGQATSGPALPHEFFGKVFIGDSPAGTGLEIEAVGPGVYSLTVELEGRMIMVQGNPVTTLAGGVYGEYGMAAQKLLVQGDIEPGTPLVFYVGELKAEVYPVSTEGPWKENYTYIPGEITELNLRIAGQPSAGQTREPTPVQTRLPASAVEGYLPEPGLATGRPAVGNTVNPAARDTPSGMVTGTLPQGTQPVSIGPPALPGTTGTPFLLAGIIVLILVTIGGVVYVIKRNRTGQEKAQETGETETEQKRED